MRGYAMVGLDHPKTLANLGGALRAAHVYRAAGVVVAAHRFRRAPTNTTKAERHVPTWLVDDVFDVRPHDCQAVAVDIVDGAVPLPRFVHPHRALYVFGAEDQTLGARIIERCQHVVMVPTAVCMNLAAAVNVVLYDRMVKRGEWG